MHKLQNAKPLEQFSQRHLRYAELLAEGNLTKADAMRGAGFAESMCRKPDFIGKDRDGSKYPALWDYYQKLRAKHIRLLEVNVETIRDEFRLIGFAKLTDFIQLPTRKDLERQKLFDAKLRQQMGYCDEEDDALLAQEDQYRKELSQSKAEKLQRFAPGSTVKLRCLEDIPEEFLPAIQSIRETRDGIEIKLHNKLDALDKLARILKMYEEPDAGSKPTTIENLNVIVNGTKSNLLKDLDNI